jgi:stage II sporulation protein AA (anti-sigma F factor antagonist)
VPAALLLLAGELDIATAPLVTEAANLIDRTTPECVIVDLSGLEFVDAAGLSALIQTREELTASGFLVLLRGTPPCLRRILEITKLTRTFAWEPPV